MAPGTKVDIAVDTLDHLRALTVTPADQDDREQAGQDRRLEWSTMVMMAKRFGHLSLNDLRDAVENISSAPIQTESPVFPPA